MRSWKDKAGIDLGYYRRTDLQADNSTISLMSPLVKRLLSQENFDKKGEIQQPRPSSWELVYLM